ncbi:MAG: hypothetical protein IT303_16160 [Dehalococcoidia bacterium]|nr:hypothetical protein [Dehalococcoidia bacterium]
MALHADSVDVTDIPGLGELAEEVRASNQPRVLRRGGEEIAKIVPMRRGKARGRPSAEQLEAFLATAGGWSGVDVDAFLEENRKSRGGALPSM